MELDSALGNPHHRSLAVWAKGAAGALAARPPRGSSRPVHRLPCAAQPGGRPGWWGAACLPVCRAQLSGQARGVVAAPVISMSRQPHRTGDQVGAGTKPQAFLSATRGPGDWPVGSDRLSGSGGAGPAAGATSRPPCGWGLAVPCEQAAWSSQGR